MTVPTGPALNVARPPGERAALLVWMKEQLHAEYGERVLRPRREPMHELISTILSGRTTHDDEEAAYHSLRELGDWDAIIDAPVADVTHAIRRSNYPEQKASRIQAALRQIKEKNGSYDLDFLRDMPVKEALKWLTDLAGVGVKTASLLPIIYQSNALSLISETETPTSRAGAGGHSRYEPKAVQNRTLSRRPL